MAESEPRKCVCLLITEEQEQFIEWSFNSNNWDLIRASPSDHLQLSITTSDHTSPTSDVNAAIYPAEPERRQPPLQAHQAGQQECPHCYCAPCIVVVSKVSSGGLPATTPINGKQITAEQHL